MRTKYRKVLTLFLAFVVQFTFAQDKAITGTVTDDSGLPLPGVNIVKKGSSTGTQTDFDGKYSIQAASGEVLVFSFLGFTTQDMTVGTNSSINLSMAPDASELDEVVVTALGIKREKKSLGYATQEVDGSEVTKATTTNFINSISGKVAGVKIRSTGTLGGSSNVVIRGNTSLTGNNQALFVVDGTPINNDTNNTLDQRTGRGGYDYGNAAQDINPEDIESINILKGAAATVLYGSRAANGAVIIVTKKGSRKKGIGVSVSSTITSSSVDKSTLPDYQNEYGAGYGAFYGPDGDAYFNQVDINGNGAPVETVPFTEDASYGAAFDPNRLVYQWTSIYPELPGYRQATPWIAPESTPNSIWENGFTTINSVALDGGNEDGTFRMGFTNLIQDGALPNSSLKRNTIKLSGAYNLTEKLKANANVSYIRTDGKGRNGTGYDSRNIMQSFRQWNQRNVDFNQQKDAYFLTGNNITWNPQAFDNRTPIYTDNPYWTLFENFQTDNRNRLIGNTNVSYQINNDLSILGRFTFDTYDELREQRINVGSNEVSQYSRSNNRIAEFNYDLILNLNKDLSDDVNVNGNFGFNLRRNYEERLTIETTGGLNAPRFYALSNSVGPLDPVVEYEATKSVDGIFGQLSLGYKDTYFIEGTLRRDRSSALAKDNNTYWYPSISTSILLSNAINAEWLNFAKIRANYAEVGNDTRPYRVFNTYVVDPSFGGNGIATNNSQLNNTNLRSENTQSFEVGLESKFWDNRIGLDISYYSTETFDLITPVPVSNATGFNTSILNAGTLENKGIEVLLNLTPIKLPNFSWDLTVNWAQNKSEVLSLIDGIENLELASFQGGVSINAAPGQPYGAIRGNDYQYDSNGNKIVGSNGYYLKSDANNEIIGNIQADWTGGIQNQFTYKNLSLDFLIDIQKGGDVFSLDTWYGYATGLYKNTAGLNDLGNPIRNPVTNDATSGGSILPGVTETGEINTVRASFSNYANPLGYARDTNKGHIYDASFVKLREISLTYRFSDKVLGRLPITGASVSLIGRNLWIIDKNTPHTDPEAGLSGGNFQGYQSGAYPNLKEFGANIKFNF